MMTKREVNWTADAESGPIIVACRARIAERQAAALRVAQEYDQHVQDVDNMMTLGGHTY